jgi:threonine/homoserine/homoserine lactone efflux protein
MLAAFLTFAVVASVTPGPNNIMLLASGANFGFRRTLPHLLGVILGFGLMVLLVGLGLAAALARFPTLFTLARIAGIAYLVYLAIKIARADGIGADGARATPMSFAQAIAFQWINPKGWSMAVSAVTAYAPTDHARTAVVVFTAIFIAIGVPNSALWTGMGVALKRGLAHPKAHRLALRAFNIAMAVALLASLVPMAKSELPHIAGAAPLARAEGLHFARWPMYRPLQ